MKDLTLTQEFLLCQMNKKGEFASPTLQFALGVSVLYELFQNDCISLEKVIELKSEPAKELEYLTLVYDFIKIQKNLKLKNIIEKILYNDKLLKQVFNHCKETLVENGCISEVERKGLLHYSKTINIPKEDCTDFVVQKIRAEVLETGEISENTIALIALLQKTEKLKEYFSKYEMDTLKTRIKELKTDEQYKFIFKTIEEMELSLSFFFQVIMD